MDDPRIAIQKMFEENNRYGIFGNMLIQVHVKGFRCHANTIIDIKSSITAFCGLNGTGKSTLLQLVAASYKSPDKDKKPYYISDFLVTGPLDPTPFSENPTVEYKFWQEDRSLKRVTLSLNEKNRKRRWQGYKRRPQRPVFFAGMGLYLPMIEKRNFIFRNAGKINVSSYKNIPTHIKKWTCRILSQTYDNIVSNKVEYSQQTGDVISVQRLNIKYSEAHMGCGEGRTQYLINVLECLPMKSLVLIEEPETSLHPSAQHEFGMYLMDVVKRKHHQIFLTTHSEFILESLPSESRIYLKKTNENIIAIPGLTTLEAKSLMTEGHVRALYVLVEDKCAKSILSELIRRIDLDFLSTIGIFLGGGADQIKTTVKALKETGLPVIAVRDGDKEQILSENIFKLPGSEPPEKEIFKNEVVKQYIQSTYGISWEDFGTSLIDVDHHHWFEKLADRISQDESALIGETARIYARSLPESEARTLLILLKEASRR